MSKHLAGVVLLAVVLAACGKNNKVVSENDLRSKYVNVLDVTNTPKASEDWNSFCFSDLGAWFGFALPDSNDSKFFSAFTGPFVMTEGKWFGRSLVYPRWKNPHTGEYIDLSEAEVSLDYLPGKLSQAYKLAEWELESELIFVNEHTVVQRYTVINTSNKVQHLQMKWEGELFLNSACYQYLNGNLVANSLHDSTYFVIQIDKHPKNTISPDKTLFVSKVETIEWKKNERKLFEVSITFNGNEFVENADTHFELNAKRWNTYIKKVIATNQDWGKELSYQRIAVKSLNTLLNNWRKPYGHLLHQGLFPSYAVDYFNGFWAWDSWKHAVALAYFEPELAKDQIRTMFDYQNTAGMVADCIYSDSSENNWLNTKPPLATWSVLKVFNETNDTAFVREMLPRLEKYHQWWYTYRDYNKNLLCEYGSSDQSLVAAKWESGMDNAIRFDNSGMIRIDADNWAFSQESIDLNAYLYMEKLQLAKLYELLGDSETANKFLEAAEKIKLLINLHLYDTETGYYYDLDTKTKSLVTVQGSEGWSPLFAGVASESQAENVMMVMMDSSKFSSYIPFPTASIAEKEFSKGYWRGPIWLDQTYFAIAALAKYGKSDEAKNYSYQVFNRLEGLHETAPIRENYWPLDGKGMRVNHFSWSAAHLLMLYKSDF